MGTPDKSSEKKKLSVSDYLFRFSLLVCVIGIGWLFLYSWGTNAYSIKSTNPLEIQNQNETVIRIYNSTLVVENYLPMHRLTLYPRLTTNASDPESYIANNESSLEKEGITISSYEIKATYGDSDVRSPLKVVNSTTFPNITIASMSKTSVTINWQQNITELDVDPSKYNVSLLYGSGPNFEGNRVTRSEVLQQKVLKTVIESAPYLFFVFSGFIFSLFAFGKGSIMTDFGILSKFPKVYQAAKNDKERKKITDSLESIIAFPKKTGKSWRFIFGLSIFIVKALVNNNCKEQHAAIGSNANIVPYRQEKLSEILGKYKKQTFEKVQDTLPELKTIAVVVTFITSLGITFSFNAGAIVPLVYSIVLFYFFFNVGSILQLVFKSINDLKWAIVTIALTYMVIALPNILEILRYL